MKTKVISASLALTLLLSGCGGQSPDKPTDSGSTSTITTTLESHTISAKAPGAYETQVVEYDLGDLEYTAQSGKVMPFRLRGVMGVPQGEGPFPLLLITHGSHSNEDDSLRFDTGFTYLVEALAAYGYLTVSMDMSSAYLWKYGDSDDKEKSIHIAGEQLQRLQAANGGDTAGFPVDLTGKVDVSNVGLIGHSRGGDTIFDLALTMQAQGIGINGLLSIAPVLPNDLESKEWPSAAVSILVPEYDGDVVSLDGFAIDTILGESTDTPHALTYLRRANHNYFNRNLTFNDASMARGEDELQDQISPEAQQAFLVQYAADFFQFALEDDAKDTLFDQGIPLPNEMYGLDVATRIGGDADRVIFAATEGSAGLSAENCQVTAVQDSWFFQQDEVIADTLTFGNEAHQTKALLGIQWQESGGNVSLAPQDGDFSAHDTLVLELATDPADVHNDAVTSQSLTVSLTDRQGNTAAVTLPSGLNALTKAPGRLDVTPMEDTELKFWSHPSPITGVSIPLETFEGVSLEDVVSVALLFDQTDSGAVYLDSISLHAA